MKKALFIIGIFGILLLTVPQAQALVLTPTADGTILDGFIYNFGLVPKDGIPDQVDGDQSVQVFNNTLVEEQGTIEFDVTGVSNPVTSAYLKLTAIDANGPYPLNLEMYTYDGDGALTLSDFNAGSEFNSFDYNGEKFLNLDVTSFVQDLKTDNGDFAGFNLRLLNVAPIQTGPPFVAFGSLEEPQAAQLFLNEKPNVVPEPTTLFMLGSGMFGNFFLRLRRVPGILTL